MEEAIAGLMLAVMPPWKLVSRLRMMDFRNFEVQGKKNC